VEEDRLTQAHAEETRLAQLRAEEVRLKQLRTDNPEGYLFQLKAKNDPRWESEFKALNPSGFKTFVAERQANEEQQRKAEIEDLLSRLKATPTNDIDALRDTYARLAALDAGSVAYKDKAEALNRQIAIRDRNAEIADQKVKLKSGGVDLDSERHIYSRLGELEPKNAEYTRQLKRVDILIAERGALSWVSSLIDAEATPKATRIRDTLKISLNLEPWSLTVGTTKSTFNIDVQKVVPAVFARFHDIQMVEINGYGPFRDVRGNATANRYLGSYSSACARIFCGRRIAGATPPNRSSCSMASAGATSRP
jgi:hypothetical protein